MTTMPGDVPSEVQATSVLVICGAGASSTFVAMWLRHAAAERELAVTASASSEDELDAVTPGIDVVLVGPHLADRYDAIARRVRAAGAEPVLLPDEVMSERSGDRALDLVLQASAERIASASAEPSAHRERNHG
jgi:PTS system cellobiose-specific IIB component